MEKKSGAGLIGKVWGVCIVGIFLLFTTGCGTKTTVVLLPEPDGSVGKVSVSGQDSSREVLEHAYESARVAAPGKPVEQKSVMEKDEVQSTFGQALAAQPLPPVVFILYFNSGGTDLTDDSTAMIPDILESIKKRRSTDVTVVGHSDRVGDAEKNRVLSQERAGYVVDLLTRSGVKHEVIEASSHGENNPLVPTEDDVAEPKNRRVEVMVR